MMSHLNVPKCKICHRIVIDYKFDMDDFKLIKGSEHWKAGDDYSVETFKTYENIHGKFLYEIVSDFRKKSCKHFSIIPWH